MLSLSSSLSYLRCCSFPLLVIALWYVMWYRHTTATTNNGTHTAAAASANADSYVGGGGAGGANVMNTPAASRTTRGQRGRNVYNVSDNAAEEGGEYGSYSPLSTLWTFPKGGCLAHGLMLRVRNRKAFQLVKGVRISSQARLSHATWRPPLLLEDNESSLPLTWSLDEDLSVDDKDDDNNDPAFPPRCCPADAPHSGLHM